MNKDLQEVLDQITTQRLENLRMTIAIGGEARIEAAVKGVVIIGTKTATGSLIYIARHEKDPRVQEILTQQISTHSPLRKEYRQQLLEIIPDSQRLARIYATYDDEAIQKPVWHARAKTFSKHEAEDMLWLDRILRV